MNFLSLFVLIPVLMTCAMFCTSNARTVRTVMMTGASMLLGSGRCADRPVFGRAGVGQYGRDALYGRRGLVRSAEHTLFGRRRRHIGGHAAALVDHRLYRGAGFVEDGRDAARVFRVVLAAVDRRIRLFYLDRPVHDVPVLRGCADSDVPAHRRMGYGTQGILGHEADADADGRIGPAAGGHFGHLFPFGSRGRAAFDEYSRDIQAYDPDERAVPVFPRSRSSASACSARCSRSIRGRPTVMLWLRRPSRCCMPAC